MATRRKHKRVRARGIGAQVLRGNELTLAPVEDLSASGAFLRTAHQFELGTLVDLSLVRPGQSAVTLHIPARVANRRDLPGKPAGVGLHFERLSPEQDRALRQVLAELGVTDPDEGESVSPLPPPPLPTESRTQLFGAIDPGPGPELDEDVTLPVPPPAAAVPPQPESSMPPPPRAAEPRSPTLTGDNSRLINEVRSLLQDFDRPPEDEPPKEGFSAIDDDASLELHVDKSARHRRKHTRVRARGVAAQVRSDAGVTTATVEDLSAGGAFLRTAETYPIGATVNLTLVRPGMKRAINVAARVANVRSGKGKAAGIGVKFETIRAEAEERLKAILRDLGLVDPFQPDVPPPSEAPQEPAKAWAPAPEPPAVDARASVGASSRRGFNVLSVEQVDASVPSAGHYTSAKPEPRSSPLPPPVSPHLHTPEPERAVAAALERTPGPPVATPPPPSVAPLAPPPGAAAAFPSVPPVAAMDPVMAAAYAPTVATRRATSPAMTLGGTDIVQRMMVQVRGVLMELGEAQAQIQAQERELESLRLEVERLRAEVRLLRGK